MKRSHMRPVGVKGFLRLWRKNRFLVLFFCLFFLGLLSGIWVIKSDFSMQADAAGRIMTEFEKAREQKDFVGYFLDSFRSAFMLLVPMFLLGFFALGVPALFTIPFLKGLGVGYLMGYLYLSFSWAGVGYAALILILPCCFFVPLLFFGWKEALFSAGALFRFCCGEQQEAVRVVEKRERYCLRFGVLGLLFVVYAAVEGLVNFLFSGIFQFHY